MTMAHLIAPLAYFTFVALEPVCNSIALLSWLFSQPYATP